MQLEVLHHLLLLLLQEAITRIHQAASRGDARDVRPLNTWFLQTNASAAAPAVPSWTLISLRIAVAVSAAKDEDMAVRIRALTLATLGLARRVPLLVQLALAAAGEFHTRVGAECRLRGMR